MKRSAHMEIELLNYWLAMRKMNALYRMSVFMPDEAEDVRAELEAIKMHTDWPLLRDRCADAIVEANLAVDVA